LGSQPVLPGKFSTLLRHVLRHSIQASSPRDGTTARRSLRLRPGSGITRLWPPPSVVTAKNHLDEIAQPRLLCHTEQVALPRSVRASEQRIQGREIDLMEKCRNEANRSGVCHCQIRAYDKNAEVPARPLLADETSGTLLFPTKRPSSAGESGSCRSSYWSHKVGDLFRAFLEPRRSAVPCSGVVTGPPAGVGGGLGPSLAAYNSALLGLFYTFYRSSAQSMDTQYGARKLRRTPRSTAIAIVLDVSRKRDDAQVPAIRRCFH